MCLSPEEEANAKVAVERKPLKTPWRIMRTEAF
jgi:hypothetical protein